MDIVKDTKHCPPIDCVGKLDPVNLFGETTLQAPVKANYNWTVCDFGTCSGVTEKIRSPIFSHPNLSKWCIELEKESGTPRLCFVLMASSDSKPVGATLGAFVSDAEGTKRQVYRLEFCTLQIGERSPLQCIVDNFDGEDWTFECEVCIVDIASENTYRTTWEIRGGLNMDLKGLWESKEYTDFTLCVKGVELKAHRAILSVRSPVFGAMLRHDTEEAREGRVEIADMDPEVASEMLSYIYTDRVLLPSDITEKLLVAFDRYGLEHAKSKCEYSLVKELTVENAAVIAACAILTSSVYLQKMSVAFIKLHLEQVVRTRGWADIIDQYPVAVKIISELVARGSKRKRAKERAWDDY